LPAAASDFSCDIAEKSLVNDDAEMVGVAAVVELLLVGGAELAGALELELDELPHAAIATLTTSIRAAMTGLLFSKDTMIFLSPLATTPRGHTTRSQPPSGDNLEGTLESSA
jgi:hypothetical protein